MENSGSNSKAIMEPFYSESFSIHNLKDKLNMLEPQAKLSIHSQTSCDDDASPNESSNDSTCQSPKPATKEREKPFKCQVCDQTFTQISNLRRHERIHNGERPYTCSVCEKKFSTSSNLKQHFLVHTTKSERSKITCKVCGSSYFYKSSLIKHMKHHQDQSKAEKQSKKAHDTRIEEPVVKKQFVTQTHATTVPAINPLDNLCQKENVLNLLNFWDTNCQQWLKSKLPVSAMNMLPPPLPIFNPLQLMQGMFEKQIMTPKIEKTFNPKVICVPNVNSNPSTSEKETGLQEVSKEIKKDKNEGNNSNQKTNDVPKSTTSASENRGLEKLEHRILVPKPIKANYSTD